MGCSCEKLKLRPIYNKGIKADTKLAGTLTEAQIAIIRHNWQTLKVHIANVGVITYVSMFESKPELKEVFEKFKGHDIGDLKSNGLLRQHAFKVMATIDKCISRLDEPENLAKLLIEAGAMHNTYKVPPEYIQIIFPHFLNAIKPHIEDYWSDEIANAWKTLFKVMTYYMEFGMTKGITDVHATNYPVKRES